MSEPQQFIITPVASHRGQHEYWLWEYDLSKPRQIDAADRRAHYAVKRLVDVFRKLPEAEAKLRGDYIRDKAGAVR